jgi:predicted nucleic acid-binding protein
MYLIDTNVVSELRKTRLGRADAQVVEWSKTTTLNALFLSAISLMELEIGILLAARRDAAKGAVLRNWLTNEILPNFVNRILPIGSAVAVRCAALHVPDRKPERDALIAATAAVHDMTVVTRNARDFAGLGVTVLNPWNYAA